MRTEADTFIFIDSDMAASPDEIMQLVESPKLGPRSAVCGAYFTQGGDLAGVPLDMGEPIAFKAQPRFAEMALAGLGFAAIERATIEALERATPPVRSKLDEVWRPYFLPIVVQQETPDGEVFREYLADDFSFWWRVRTIGETLLWMDTHLRVGHVKNSVLVPGDTLFPGFRRVEIGAQ